MDDNKIESKKQLGDKIFGAHNNPTKDYDHVDNFDVDKANLLIGESYDEEDYLHNKKLEEYYNYKYNFLYNLIQNGEIEDKYYTFLLSNKEMYMI